MSNNRFSALSNIVKALAGITFTTSAAVYGVQGNPVMAGLSTVAAAGITGYDVIRVQMTNLHAQKQQDILITLLQPSWWTSDAASWHGLCAEIVNYFPDIVLAMNERLQQYHGQDVLTREVVLSLFSDILTGILDTHHLTWLPINIDRKEIAEAIFIPVLEKLGESFSEEIKRIQYETALQDTHAIASNTQMMVSLLEGNRSQINNRDIYHHCQNYCRKLYDQWRMLDFKGIQHIDPNRTVSIPLTDVFILPDVLIGVPEYETLERDETQKRDILKKEMEESDLEDEWENLGHNVRKPSKEKSIIASREDFHTVLAKNPRLIILGDPGSGKSTLLRYLMLTLASSSSDFISEFPQLGSDIFNMIPLYIPIGSYAESWNTIKIEERSLKDFLSKHLRMSYLDAYISTVESQLEQGQVLILLDGLDEIPDASFRMQIVRQIEIFTQSYPQNRYIVTSRIVGYKDAPLAAEYQAYTLADFSEEQIKAFTKKWCPSYERWVNQVVDNQALQEAATKEADKLFRATRLNEGVKQLAVNPLLLTILALIQRQGIELPSHRVELFDLCVTTLLETWLKAKGLTAATRFSKSDFVKILRPLAFWMHNHPAVGAIPEDELLEQIVRQLMERRVCRTENEAEQLAEQFLQTLRGKTGILVERGRRRYGFLHLTFEEYFAAWDIVIRKKDRIDFIKKHLHDPRWRVVIQLTVGIIGILQSDEDGVTELVEEAILKANSPFEKWLHRDLLFAGLCLADNIGLNSACEDAIIERIVYLYHTSPYDPLRTQFSRIFATWRGTFVATKAIDLLLVATKQHGQKINSTLYTSIMTSSFSSKSYLGRELSAYHQEQLRQSQEATIRLMHISIITELCHFVDMTDQLLYILEAFSDSDTRVCRAAARALGQMGLDSPSVINTLLKALSDPATYLVRDAAASALGQIGNNSPEVINALLNLLFTSGWTGQDAAASALGQIGNNSPEVINALIKVLSFSFTLAQQSAATALGQIGNNSPEVVNALLKTFADSSSSLRRSAARSLGQLGNNSPQVIDALILQTSEKEADVRKAAVEALGQLGNNLQRVSEALLNLLSDKELSVREAAAEALSQAGNNSPQVIETLLNRLLSATTNWLVRNSIIKILSQLGNNSPQVIDALITKLSDIDSDVREAAVETLGQLRNNSAQVIDALITKLSDVDSDVREAAAEALGRLGDNSPQVIDALITGLSDVSDVREAAAIALGQLGNNSAQVIDALDKLLSDSSVFVRGQAVEVLSRLDNNSPQVIDTLVGLLSDASTFVRKDAVRVVGQLDRKSPEVIEALLDLLSDKEASVRTEVAMLLGQLGSRSPEVIETLLNRLTDSNVDAQKAVAEALGQTNSNSPEIIKALLTLLTNSNSSVQKAAATALKQINSIQPLQIKIFTDALINTSTLLLIQKEKIDEEVQRFRKRFLTRTYSLLGEINSKSQEVIDILLKSFSDSDASVREAAATALGQINANSPEIADHLLKLLTDSNISVKAAAVTALGQLGNNSPKVVYALLKLCSEKNTRYDIREAVPTAIGQLGNNSSEVIDILLKSLYDSNSYVREAAAKALEKTGNNSPKVINTLLKRLSEKNLIVRKAAARALGQIGINSQEVINAFFSLLSAPGWLNEDVIATTIGRVKDNSAEVTEVLLKRLSDPDSSVREAAATSLGQIGTDSPKVKEALLNLLSVTGSSEREVATKALGQIRNTSPEVINALIIQLSDIDSDVRVAAAEALGQLDIKSPEVVEALMMRFADLEESVREAVAISLAKFTDNKTVCLRIEEMLKDCEPIASKQFVSDYAVDSLLSSLQRIIGEV